MKTWVRRGWVLEAAKYLTFLLRLVEKSCCVRASLDQHRTPKLCLSVSSVWCLRMSSGWREPSLQTLVSSKTHSHILHFKPVVSVIIEMLSTDGSPLLIPLCIFYPKFLYRWPRVKWQHMMKCSSYLRSCALFSVICAIKFYCAIWLLSFF